jgi:hypothetical protein
MDPVGKYAEEMDQTSEMLNAKPSIYEHNSKNDPNSAPQPAQEPENSVNEDSSTDEELDKRQFGIYRCLPVDDAEPDWAAGEASSVEEYMRRVR